jgi:PPOX class probable FMN-dependent enzyme
MEFLTDRDALRSLYREPHERAVQKELAVLDRHARAFIAKSPFLLIGSSDGHGHSDVTPRGDRPGFVDVLDDRTIAIPDRPGNNRLDTLENVIANPAVGLLFLIPNMNETLRLNGTARITVDADLKARLAVDGKQPTTVLVVTVRSVYMHCAKAFLRSSLWAPETWPARSEMPTLGEILKDQIAFAATAAETDQALADAYAKTMW